MFKTVIVLVLHVLVNLSEDHIVKCFRRKCWEYSENRIRRN